MNGRSERRHRLGRAVATLGVALIVLAALLWAVGFEAVLGLVGRLEPGDAGLLVLAGLVPLIAWGGELRVVLEGIGQPVGAARATALFAASGFLNNVTPMGELGGDVPSGLLIAGDLNTTFERGLAAITGLNVINRVAVVSLGVIALGWHGRHLEGFGGRWSAELAVGTWVALLVALVAAWAYRRRLLRRVGPPLASSISTVGRWLPVVSSPQPAAVQARLHGFVEALERLAAEPRRLATALLLGTVGHLAVATTLWLAVLQLGSHVPVHDVVLIIPLAKTAGLSPTPGGTGSATVLLAGLLVVITGVDATTATGAALLYRAAAFWVPTVLGGAITVWLVPQSGSGEFSSPVGRGRGGGR